MYQFKKLPAFLTHLLLFGLFALSPLFSNAAEMRVENSRIELTSDYDAIAAGQTFWVAWHIKLDDGWHTYWKNPGDTGLAGSATWQVPEGFNISDFFWPTPHVIETEGLINYGYEGNVTLLSKVTAPQNIKAGDTVSFSLNAAYLLCKEICLPAEAVLTLNLPVQEQAVLNEKNSELYKAELAALPQVLDKDAVNVQRFADYYTLQVKGDVPEMVAHVAYIPAAEDVIKDSAVQNFEANDTGYTLKVMRDVYQDLTPETLGGLLVLTAADESPVAAYSFNAMVAPMVAAAPAPEPSYTVDIGLLTVLLFAFLAGLILNLMPCVLPVLSLKALGLIQHTHGKNGKAHALLFGAGVIASFWILAGILLLVQNAGGSLGWGFHLQNPTFVSLLIFVLSLMALNFFGVFEMGTSLTRLGNVEKNHQGSALGSFLSGVLVTIVATPCTVPFMGTAVAFALSQTAVLTLLVFTVMGLGLALPYVVLAFVPALVNHLPKPGAWMVTFRQFLGFPLLVTALWLIWVFANQVGLNQVVPLIAGLLLAAFGAWLFGRFGTLDKPASQRIKMTIWFIVLVVLGWGLSNSVFSAALTRFIGMDQKVQAENWQPWSPQAVATALQEGKPIFMHFTADWCITCKVNERLTLNAPSVQALFKEKSVVLLKGDWTNKNAEIAHQLALFGRRGVPLYVYYDGKGNVEVLPQLLTAEIVRETL